MDTIMAASRALRGRSGGIPNPESAIPQRPPGICPWQNAPAHTPADLRERHTLTGLRGRTAR